MSLTPTTPSFDAQTIKSFWNRPEGKTGILVILASVIAGVYGVSLILPWLILMLQNTIYAAFLTVALFGVVYTVTNKTFRSIIKNLFQLSMRWTTGLLVELDPIGIQKNYLDEMKLQKAKLDQGVEGCAGSKQGLETNIQNNVAAIKQNEGRVEVIDKRANNPNRTQIDRTKDGYDRDRFMNDIGRKITSNKNLQKTLDMTNGLYTMLQEMQQLSDYNIENLTAQIDNDQQERNAILESYKALSPAQKLIKGQPEQLAIFNASREYVARDNARMLGAMKNFSVISEKYVRGMEIDQSAAAAEAEKALAEMKQTMKLADGGSEKVPMYMGVAQAEPVPARRISGGAGVDYLKLDK